MGATIDEKVLSMKFDNQQFEKNVRTSMSTLDKLKEKLNLKGASDGLQNLNKETSKFNINPMSQALDTVHSKFSALQVIGITTLANITNSAVNAGKRIIKSLTIEPVTTGFQEYELKMDSVRTIMASTGESIDTVNKYLNELNRYSDETIYSFSDMTQNIGKFTNAGVKLEDAVLAIKGISNEAAVSGANANEASRAMYNFAQALSAGYVKLIDWKSIENANMATVEFKQQLINTAVACGTLTKTSDGLYSTGKRTISATKDFNDSLQDQWMTTDVLIKTLGDYANTNTEIGKKATAAATEVTKFTQMFDVLKETAQSGWAQTWEIIFGNMEKAKKTFTPLTEFFGNIIDGISGFRNKILSLALGSPLGEIAEKFGKINETTKKASESLKSCGKIVDKVINGDFGNGKKRWDALTKAGYNWAKVQNLVNEKLGSSVRHNEKLGKSKAELAKKIVSLSDAELKNAGFTKDEIKTFRELEVQSKKTGIPIEKLIKDTDKLSGRALLIESFKNAGKGLKKVLDAIGKAWTDVFPAEDSAKKIYNFIAALHKFSLNLKMSDETADKVKRTLKGLFTLIKIVSNFVGGTFGIAVKVVSKILGLFNISILDATAYIGDAIVKFDKWLSSINPLTAAIGFLSSKLDGGIAAIKKYYNAFKNLPKVQNFIENFSSGVKGFYEVGKNIVEGLINGIKDGSVSISNILIDIGLKILNAIKNVLGIHSPSIKMYEVGKNVILGLVNGIKEFAPKVIDTIKEVASNVLDFIKNIKFEHVLAAGMLVGFIKIGKKVEKIVEVLYNPIPALSNILNSASSLLDSLTNGVTKVSKAMATKIKMQAFKDFAIALGILVASIVVLARMNADKVWEAVKILGVLSVGLFIMVGSLLLITKSSNQAEEAAKSINFAAIGAMFVGMGIAIAIMAKSLKSLSEINQTEFKQGLLGLSVIVGLMAAIILVYGLLVKGKATQNIQNAGKMMMKLSVSLLLMATVVKILGTMKPDQVLVGMACLSYFVKIFAIFTLLSTVSGKGIGKLGKCLIQISAALLLMAVVIKILGTMKPEVVFQGIMVLNYFVGIIAVLTLITQLAGQNNMESLGKALTGMAASMLILAYVVKILGTMNPDVLTQGSISLLYFVGIIALLTLIGKMAGEQKNVAKNILSMSLSIAALAIVAIILGMVSIEGLIKGVTAVAILGFVISGLIVASSLSKDCNKNLKAMVAAIAVMTIAVVALSFIKPEKLAGATAAMYSLIGAFSVMAIASGKAKGSLGSLIVMTVAIALMSGMIYTLSKLPIKNVVSSAIALSSLMLAVSAALFIVSKVKAGSAIVGIIALTAMAIPLLVFVQVLKQMDGMQVAIDNILALSLLVSVLSVALLPLTLVGSLIGPALLGVVALTAMAIPLLVFIQVIKQMNGIESATENVKILILLTGTLTLLLLPLTLIGALIPMALSGVLALTAMAVPLLAFVGILALMQGIQNAQENASLIITLMGSITNMLLQIAAVAPLALMGSAAISMMIALLTPLTLLLTGLGALMTYVPKLQEFLDTGIVVLTKIGEGIGSFAASIVNGVLSTIDLTPLVKIGQDLSAFIVAATPFITGARMINAAALEGVKSMAEVVLILTGAKLLEGLVSWATGEGVSLASFGKELADFAPHLAEFSKKTSGIKAETIKPAAEATKILAETASALPKKGGWVQAVTGENSLAAFGEELKNFGPDFAEYAKSVGKIKNWDTIKQSAEAINELVKIANEVPSEGGLVEAFTGKNDLSTFGNKLSSFGEYLAKYAKDVGGIKDWESIKQSANAAKAVIDIANEVPETGGIVKAITGDNDLETFGSHITKFSTSLVTFSENGALVDVGKVNGAISAAKAIINFAKYSEDQDYDDIEELPDGLDDLAETLKEYSDNVKNVDSAAIYNSTGAAKSLVSMVLEIGGKKFSEINKLPDLSGLAKSVKSYSESMKGINTSVVERGAAVTRSLITTIKMTDNVNVGGVTKFVTAVNKLANTNISKFNSTFKKASADAVVKAKNFVLGISKGLTDATSYGSISKAMTALIKHCVSKLSDNANKNKFKKAGTSFVSSLVSGMSDEKTKSKVDKAAKSLASNAAKAAKEKKSKFESTGKSLGDGLISGINAKKQEVYDAGFALGKKSAAGVKAGAKVNSPSKLTIPTGKSLGEGLIVGVKQISKNVYDTSKDLGKNAAKSLSTSISKIGGLIETGIDAQPTIRPVMDLSDVSNGVGAINRMMDLQTIIGAKTNISAINSMMNDRQNGNSELLSEIKGLRSDFSDVDRGVSVDVHLDYNAGSDANEIANDIATSLRRAIRRGV